jgi:uncharacterized cupin superfamily protein
MSDYIVPPDGGRVIREGPNELHLKAGRHTGLEHVGVFESEMPPGGGFPIAHVHDEYEEVFYVLEGEVEYRLGDEWTTATAGTTITVPPGTIHCFRNSSSEPARHLVVHSLAAIELIEAIGKTPPDSWGPILAKHRSWLVDG